MVCRLKHHSSQNAKDRVTQVTLMITKKNLSESHHLRNVQRNLLIFRRTQAMFSVIFHTGFDSNILRTSCFKGLPSDQTIFRQAVSFSIIYDSQELLLVIFNILKIVLDLCQGNKICWKVIVAMFNRKKMTAALYS